jgi:hypothetical protein
VRTIKTAAVAHLLLMLGCMAMFALRCIHIFRSEVVVIDREITSHSCNFALSIVLCALAVCLAMLAANVAYEAFLPFLNTCDLTDALYGIAGSAVGALCLCRLNRCGFRS